MQGGLRKGFGSRMGSARRQKSWRFSPHHQTLFFFFFFITLEPNGGLPLTFFFFFFFITLEPRVK